MLMWHRIGLDHLYEPGIGAANHMARDEARIFSAIWSDQDYLDLEPGPQRLYLFLLSQPDLSYCGVIALRESRWARKAKGMTADDIRADLKALANTSSKPFIVVDEDTEEVFVRSLIRRDGIWKQPNIMKSAREAARLIESPGIRTALAEELKRIPIEESDSRIARRVLAEFLEDLGEKATFPTDIPSANPSPDPSQGKGVRGKGSNSPAVGGEGSLSSSGADAPDQEETQPIREDVERVCAHLADRIEANGSKRPTITKTWRDAARLLMDRDGRTEDQVHRAIDWCQNDEFWRSNILSMPTLREKYDQLRLKAAAATGNGGRDSPEQATTDKRVAQAQALKSKFAASPPPNIAGELPR
ncbi:hypothetical protein JOL79_11560 [Microbispora sp. RL4-1S]|uniref:Uncharacterized protein n=1 Tax=Microbispora oryzae TaxID=2806554 RepID=A0A940WNV7_9ACTN|nr:hypothetical protein [Microbispora oryzae]MBP2704451.1 hypothetical protein [Microbispora oryzae]